MNQIATAVGTSGVGREDYSSPSLIVSNEDGQPIGEFTLSGWRPRSGAALPGADTRSRKLSVACFVVGTPALLAILGFWVLMWSPPIYPVTLVSLAVLALAAQYFPVNVSYINVSLGTGFLIAVCLLSGPVVGSLMVAVVYLIWSPTRELVPWFQYLRGHGHVERVSRVVFSVGSSAVVYGAATWVAFSVFSIAAPVASVSIETVGASIVLTVCVYVFQNLLSLAVAFLVGDDVGGLLTTEIPVPALVEFVGQPAALLLAVARVELGPGAFALLAWLYLGAAFLGWRSWQDREDIKRRLQDLELLHRVGSSLSGTLEIGEVVRRLHDVLQEITAFDSMMLLVIDDEERATQVFAFDAKGERSGADTNRINDTECRPEGLFFEADGSAVYTRDLLSEETASIRIRLDFSAADLPGRPGMVLLETVCRQAATALSNARLYRLANTDPLTGVAIRRYFERAMRTASMKGERFGLIILDLDWFKRVNDTFGHKAGDEVLRDLADVLVGSLRVTDVAARYGGEEFVIFLPGSSSPAAAAVAERIRRALERRRLMIDGVEIRYTASFGIASSEDLREGTDPMEVLWRADAALLEAKRVGRNQCITWAAIAS